MMWRHKSWHTCIFSSRDLLGDSFTQTIKNNPRFTIIITEKRILVQCRCPSSLRRKLTPTRQPPVWYNTLVPRLVTHFLWRSYIGWTSSPGRSHHPRSGHCYQTRTYRWNPYPRDPAKNERRNVSCTTLKLCVLYSELLVRFQRHSVIIWKAHPR